MGSGQAHHVLGVVGRALDEGQRLEDRVVDVGGHLGPLLGPGPGLALRHQIADQGDPPRTEDDHDGRNDQEGATDRPQRRRAGVPGDQDQSPMRPSTTPPPMRTTSVRLVWRSPPAWSMGMRSSLIHTRSPALALRRMRIEATGGEEHGPAERPEVADMQRIGQDLHHHQGRDDGDDQPDPPTVVDGPREDGAGLALQGEEEPGQGVDGNADATAEGQQDEPDADERDIDAGGLGQASTHPGQDPGIRAPPERPPQSPVQAGAPTAVPGGPPLGAAP